MNMYTAPRAGRRAWIGVTLVPSTLTLISNMFRKPLHKGAQGNPR